MSNFEGDLPFRGEAQNCVTVKFLLNPADYEVGGTRSVATKSFQVTVRRALLLEFFIMFS